jgi:hypothetical protein
MDRLPGLHEVPPAPRTPSAEARHLVFGYRGGQGVMLAVGIGFLVLGLILSTVFCWGLPIDAAIALSRRETAGTILHADTNLSTKSNGRRPTEVRFEYEGGGSRWQGESDTFEIKPGQTGPVDVEYAALNPSWGRLAGETYSTFGYLGLLTLLFPAIGAFITRRAVRSNRCEIRAFTQGRPVLARVTFRGLDHSTSVNGQHPFLMRWEFRTDHGATVHGSISSMKLQDIKAFGEAEQVVVLYDPSDPKANTLYVP